MFRLHFGIVPNKMFCRVPKIQTTTKFSRRTLLDFHAVDRQSIFRKHFHKALYKIKHSKHNNY